MTPEEIIINPNKKGLTVTTLNAGYNRILIGTHEECANYIRNNKSYSWNLVDSSYTHNTYFGMYIPRGE